MNRIEVGILTWTCGMACLFFLFKIRNTRMSDIRMRLWDGLYFLFNIAFAILLATSIMMARQ